VASFMPLGVFCACTSNNASAALRRRLSSDGG
jgi:hypothetical protein